MVEACGEENFSSGKGELERSGQVSWCEFTQQLMPMPALVGFHGFTIFLFSLHNSLSQELFFTCQGGTFRSCHCLRVLHNNFKNCNHKSTEATQRSRERQRLDEKVPLQM